MLSKEFADGVIVGVGDASLMGQFDRSTFGLLMGMFLFMVVRIRAFVRVGGSTMSGIL